MDFHEIFRIDWLCPWERFGCNRLELIKFRVRVYFTYMRSPALAGNDPATLVWLGGGMHYVECRLLNCCFRLQVSLLQFISSLQLLTHSCRCSWFSFEIDYCIASLMNLATMDICYFFVQKYISFSWYYHAARLWRSRSLLWTSITVHLPTSLLQQCRHG